MSAESTTIQFTEAEFDELIIASMTKVAFGINREAVFAIAAKALEVYADRIEHATITTTSSAAQSGADAAIKWAVGEARQMVSILQEMAEDQSMDLPDKPKPIETEARPGRPSDLGGDSSGRL